MEKCTCRVFLALLLSGWRSTLTLGLGLTCVVPPLSAQFVYVLNAPTDAPIRCSVPSPSPCGGSNDIGAYSISPNGMLVPISSVAAGSNAISLAADPLSRFLYVLGSEGISAFTIGPTGALTPIGSTIFVPTTVDDGLTLTSITGGARLVVDPAGKLLYVAASSGIMTFRIGPTGALTPSGLPVVPGKAPLAVDPRGRFLFVIHSTGIPQSFFSTGWVIMTYSIALTGALTFISSEPLIPNADRLLCTPDGCLIITSPPIAMAVDSTGRFVYSTNTGGRNTASAVWPSTIPAYSIGPTGALSPIASAVTGVEACTVAQVFVPSVVVDPTGRFLYVAVNHACGSPNNVQAFAIGAGGVLTLIESNSSAFADFFSSVAVDSTGRFVYAADLIGDRILGYVIRPNGALTFTGATTNTGRGPICLAATRGSSCLASPVISNVVALPNVLWPPNHKMVNVAVNYDVTAPCGAPTCRLDITSNEASDGTDRQVLDDHRVLLRAERGKDGRTYTVMITCSGGDGSIPATKTTQVRVPHDRSMP